MESLETLKKVMTGLKKYEVKIGRKWVLVQCEDMRTLSSICRQKNIKDWRVPGSMSISEMIESNNAPHVSEV